MMIDTDKLVREIRAQVGSTLSVIDNRKNHPSYGVRKADVLLHFHKLLGMIEAWAYVTGAWPYLGRIFYSPEFEKIVLDQLGINIQQLRDAATKS